jgi:hypothetical protein
MRDSEHREKLKAFLKVYIHNAAPRSRSTSSTRNPQGRAEASGEIPKPARAHQGYNAYFTSIGAKLQMKSSPEKATTV